MGGEASPEGTSDPLRSWKWVLDAGSPDRTGTTRAASAHSPARRAEAGQVCGAGAGAGG